MKIRTVINFNIDGLLSTDRASDLNEYNFNFKFNIIEENQRRMR